MLNSTGLTGLRFSAATLCGGGREFLSQNGQKSYAVGLVDHRYDLLWWLDYVFATDGTILKTSLTTLQTELRASDPQHYFWGITGDEWPAAKKLFGHLTRKPF